MIYVIQIEGDGPVKIGHTHGSPSNRLAHIRSSSPFKMSLIASFQGDLSMEAGLHARFAAHRIRGEWFEPCEDILTMCRSTGIHAVSEVEPRRKMKKQTTIGIEETLIPEIKAEAEKFGLGWTSMVEVLVRESLTVRKKTAAKS